MYIHTHTLMLIHVVQEEVCMPIFAALPHSSPHTHTLNRFHGNNLQKICPLGIARSAQISSTPAAGNDSKCLEHGELVTRPCVS